MSISNSLVKHFVIFNDKKGIYLGRKEGGFASWSLEGTPKEVMAPVFLGKKDFKDHLKGYQELKDFPEYRLIEVFPDVEDSFATKAACSAALLPTW